MSILLRIWLLLSILNKMMHKRVKKTLGNLIEKHQKCCENQNLQHIGYALAATIIEISLC
jgi:hypothetical protein